MPGREKNGRLWYGSSTINHLPSTTLLHYPSPSGHAWKQQRTDPIRCGCGWWCCFSLSLLPTPEPQSQWIGVPPPDGICLAEISHGGCWSCYKVSSHSARKERTEKPTNEPRDDIFSQRDMLLGCHRRRSCVSVDHQNSRCPKIFLLLLLRPPKLHVQWPSTFSIIQTVHLAVRR